MADEVFEYGGGCRGGEINCLLIGAVFQLAASACER